MAISRDINHIRAIERNRQNDCSPFQTENFSNIWGIGENDGVGELDPDTPITRSLGRYGERGIISDGVEHGNDLIDRVVTRRNSYLFVIRVREHISKIHVVENALIRCEWDSDGSDGWIPILVRIDPLERTVGKQALDKHGIMHSLSLTTTKRRMVRVVSPSQRGCRVSTGVFCSKNAAIRVCAFSTNPIQLETIITNYDEQKLK